MDVTKQDLILDLETLGNTSNAAVVSIGAVWVDRGTRTIGDSFHIHINLEDVVRYGGVADASTTLWWVGESDAARQAMLAGQADSVCATVGLLRFLEFIGTDDDGVNPDVRVWGNGATFDCTILRNMFARHGLTCPWAYWNERDLRTLVDVSGLDKHSVPKPEGFIAHHAEWDARHQAGIFLAAADRLPTMPRVEVVEVQLSDVEGAE